MPRAPRSSRSRGPAPRSRRAAGKKIASGTPRPKAGRPERLADQIAGGSRQRRHAVARTALSPEPLVRTAGTVAVDTGPGEGTDASPLALATPDWLAHTLTVTGPADRVAAFRAAAAGPGLPPYQDRARLEADVMHALLAPPPVLRKISVAGARILAGQIGARIDAQASRAAGRAAISPLDLHALLPVPPALWGLPPDDPRLTTWLWRHWGTTWPLRHVEEDQVSDPELLAVPAGQQMCRYRFWSADWTPWAAMAAIRTMWPDLCFAISIHYGDA
jgi:hypothetical protein